MTDSDISELVKYSCSAVQTYLAISEADDFSFNDVDEDTSEKPDVALDIFMGSSAGNNFTTFKRTSWTKRSDMTWKKSDVRFWMFSFESISVNSLQYKSTILEMT